MGVGDVDEVCVDEVFEMVVSVLDGGFDLCCEFGCCCG